jgi:hypothetical protein
MLNKPILLTHCEQNYRNEFLCESDKCLKYNFNFKIIFNKINSINQT